MNTQKEFWAIAEIWHQRTHRLRELAENELETPVRRSKALKLFLLMVPRMQMVAQIALRLSTPKRPTNITGGEIIHSGGIRFTDHKD